MYRVFQKLKNLKNPIRSSSKDNYSGLEKRTEEAHVMLLDLQKRMLTNPSSALAEV